MAKLQLIITGCGHSGTTYLSSLLQRAGFNAFHESAARPGFFRPESDQQIEVSWLAAGYDIPDDIEVMAVVRHPCDVANSFRGFFDPNRSDPYSAFIRERLMLNTEFPELDYWLDWNARAFERAGDPSNVFRIEDLDINALLDRLAEKFRQEVTEEQRRAAHETPRANVRNHEYLYGTIEDYDRLEELRAACEVFEYSLDEYVPAVPESEPEPEPEPEPESEPEIPQDSDPGNSEPDTSGGEESTDGAQTGAAGGDAVSQDGEAPAGGQAEAAPPVAGWDDITIESLEIGSKPHKPTRLDMMEWLRQRNASYETDDNRDTLVERVLKVAKDELHAAQVANGEGGG